MNDNFKKFYDDNGYVILEKIFSDSEAEKFNSSVRRHANTDKIRPRPMCSLDAGFKRPNCRPERGGEAQIHGRW